MHLSADFVTWFDKFLFQLKALQKRVQKDENRFIVPQAVPEIYRKNERFKNRGMCFFCYRLYVWYTLHVLIWSNLYVDTAFTKIRISGISMYLQSFIAMNGNYSRYLIFLWRPILIKMLRYYYKIHIFHYRERIRLT